MEHLKNFKCGMRDGVPIALGYFAVSFTFGIMASQAGISVLQATLISFLNVTSAGQFAGLDIIVSGGTYLEMIMTQLVINLRYSLMSFALSQKLDSKTKDIHRFGIAYGVTDEIFGISAGVEGALDAFYNYGAMAVAIPGWIIGTITGAVFGNILPQMAMSALSVAIYGMFLAIIIPPAKKNKAVFYVIISTMLLSCCFKFLPIINRVSSGFAIIITAVLVSGVAAYICPAEEQCEK